MFTLCGCQLTTDDVTVLIGRLDDDHTVLSDEAAAALRYAVAANTPTLLLDYDLRDAIEHVLHEPLPVGLSKTHSPAVAAELPAAPEGEPKARPARKPWQKRERIAPDERLVVSGH